MNETFSSRVKKRVRELIGQRLDVDDVYDIIREEFGEDAIPLVANCYFEGVAA